MAIVDEPVRGDYPPPEAWSLPGVEFVRALVEGRIPRPPLHHLTAMKVTHAAPGTATLTMPASPWLGLGPRTVLASPLVAQAHMMASFTVAPPATVVGVLRSSVDFIRQPVVAMGHFVAKARVVMAGRTRTTTEVEVEDAAGRLVLRSSAQAAHRPWLGETASGPLPPHSAPARTSPDLALAPLPPDLRGRDRPRRDGRYFDPARPAGALEDVPVAALLGMRLLDLGDGALSVAVPTSRWLTVVSDNVWPAMSFAGAGPLWAIVSALEWPELPAVDAHAVTATSAAVPPVGRDLVVQARVVHRDDLFVVADGEVIDADGERLLLMRTSATITEAPDAAEEPEAERALLAVLFVDVVDSTRSVERLGDATWRQVLERSIEVARREIAAHRGREVKNQGDGFLAVFDAPARAVRCAREVREGFAALGVQVRAGIHLGEVELVGDDVAGIAVHVAARVESMAEPSAIFVTGTVRQAMAGSGVSFSPRGTHRLKGVSDDWELFAVEG